MGQRPSRRSRRRSAIARTFSDVTPPSLELARRRDATASESRAGVIVEQMRRRRRALSTARACTRPRPPHVPSELDDAPIGPARAGGFLDQNPVLSASLWFLPPHSAPHTSSVRSPGCLARIEDLRTVSATARRSVREVAYREAPEQVERQALAPRSARPASSVRSRPRLLAVRVMSQSGRSSRVRRRRPRDFEPRRRRVAQQDRRRA